jgi:hypothetical protein
MDETRRTTQEGIVAAPVQAAKAGASRTLLRPIRPERHGVWQSAIPVAFVVLLLMLATTSQGAFAVSRWAPLALFALALLIGAFAARGRLAVRAGSIHVALFGIWGLAAWSMLSMLWAKSSDSAFSTADHYVLYAAIVTLPFALPASRRSLAAAGWAIAAGIGVLGVYTLVRLLGNGESLFLAGRLNGPVNYRNATALLFVLPFWPFIVAAAAQSYRRAVRAAALAGATLCLSLAFMTQARGIVVGLALGAVIALGLGPDRVRRAWLAILEVCLVVAASPWLLRPFHAWDAGHGVARTADIAVAARATALLTVAAFGLGMVIALFDRGLRTHAPQMRYVHRAARVGLAAVAICAIVGGLAAIGNPASFARRQWDQFTNLNAATPTSTRFASVGGQRYDLWRVALKEFSGAPLVGVGAGNYSFDYYRFRRTNRNLSDPHSLEFSLLSEGGLVGAALFAAFLGGFVWATVRGWPGLDAAARRNAVGPLATGAVLLGQSSVDWIWLIPGLTSIGLFALSLGVAQTAIPEADRAESEQEAEGAAHGARSGRQLASRVLVGTGLAAATIGILGLFMYNAYLQRARGLIYQPGAELSAARTAARLDPWSVTPLYLEASAYESMGDRAAAYSHLRQALELEPANFATLGVIGDFEARGRRYALARYYYRRALALDPLDTGLQQLARIGLKGPPGTT